MLADPNNMNRQEYEILLDAAKNWKIYNYKEFIDDYIRTDRIKFNNNGNIYYLDLKNSKLIGNIPDNIFSSLNKLEVLIMNDNQLSGNIPDSIGLLNNISEINLNNNQLSGNIPHSIGNLLNFNRLRKKVKKL